MRPTCVLSILCLAAACGVDEETIPPPVILISLDTVRADALSCYGDADAATPSLDAFAAQGDRYAHCVSAAPWTMPTHASLFTGLYPFEHGAHSFLPENLDGGDNIFALHPRIETLAEALAARGYRTAGVVANAHYLRPSLGLEAGFETWDVSREPGGRVNKRALAWLDQYGQDPRPTFLFVNYMDAHRPYRTGDPNDRAAKRLDELIDRVLVRGDEAGELGDDVRALHRKAVTRLDGILGAFFDGLKERDLFDRSLIIVTSDHGEAFGAHGIVEHSKDVYEDVVRVPLLVKLPGQTGGRVVTRLASSVDVAGLIGEALAGTSAESMAAIYPRTPGSHVVVAENHFSRVKDLKRYGERFRRQRRAVYDGRWKLIVGSDGSVELFDLVEDPSESNDVAAAQSKVVERMAARLEALVDATAFEGDRVLPGQLTEAQRDEMSALGYADGRDEDR